MGGGDHNTLELISGGNELKALNMLNGVALDLSLRQGSTSILEKIDISKNKNISFYLNDKVFLTFKNNLVNNGGATFAFNQANGTYSINGMLSTSGEGKNIFDLTNKSATINNDLAFSGSNVLGEGGNIINIGANQTFTLQSSVGGISTPRSILTTSGATYLNLIGDNSTLSGNIYTSSGNTIINFSGDSQLSGTLEISDIGNTEIIVKSGKTGTISKPINANGKTLNINLGDNSTLALNGNLSTAKGNTTISFSGANGVISGILFSTSNGASTTFELGARDSQSVIATINGTLNNTNGTGGTNSNYNGGENFFAINAENTTLINGANGLEFLSGLNIISFENTNGAILHWKGTSKNDEQNITTTGGNTEIRFSNSGVIAGGINTSGGNTTLYLGGANNGDKIEGVINGAITSNGNGTNNVEFDNSNNTLTLKDNATFSQISNLNNESNNGISFYHDSRSSTDFKTLTIGTKGGNGTGISGNNLNFLVYATTNETKTSKGVYADKIIIHSSSNNDKTTHNLGVRFKNQDTINLDAITYTKGGNDNILIATVADSSKISFNTQEKMILGFDVAQIQYIKENTNEDGKLNENGEYVSYFIGNVKATSVSEVEQQVTATAFMLNYDLYMANFNSLNKRMGELRNNANSQGAWARIFNGSQSNNFGLGSTSNYTTFQVGYDYAFGFSGANNYLGFALSYALSTSKSKNSALDSNGQQRKIDNIYSNAVEFAIYNAYVQDGASKGTGWKNGLYTDSILKFSYLLSSFDIQNTNKQTTTSNDTKNFAFTLSQEVGYRFLLGESKEWYITPQVELSFGYFDQSNFKQVLKESGAYLDGNADSVITLRSRIGSSYGYDFKQFTESKGFNAKAYLGTYFEYDYITGGDIKLLTNRDTQANAYSNLQADQRFVLNVGSNFSIKENHRIYFDFESSFGGLLTTNYQVNLGYRYSFGTSKYTPYNEIETTPLDKPSNTLNEVAPTKGYYVELLKVTEKPSKKQEKVLKQLEEQLKTQSTLQDNKTTKTYLVGPFKSEEDAKKAKESDLAGSIKELKSSAEVIEIK